MSYYRVDHGLDADRLFHIVDAATAAARWEAGAQGATQKYVDGVQGTQKDVVGNAIRAQSALLANFTQAVSSGLWARRLTESGGTGNWKQKTVAKAANYGVGVTAAKDAFQAAMAKLLPYIAAGQGQVQQMPSGSIAASKARVNFWIDYMHAYRQTR